MDGNKMMTVPRPVDADELGSGAHARAHQVHMAGVSWAPNTP
jgi:hypothetical protein